MLSGFEDIYIPFMELGSLTLFLMLLYWLRRSIGIIPMYLLLGLFFVCGQVAMLPILGDIFTEAGKLGTLAYGLLLLPLVAMYIIIYEEEGTLEAQRFILGMLMAVIGFIYITQLVLGQYQYEPGSVAPDFIRMLLKTRTFVLPLVALTFTHLVLLLIIPVGYQTLRNLHFPACVALFLHLFVFVLVSNIVQSMMNPSRKLDLSMGIWLSWLLSAALICLMVQCYLVLNRRSLDKSRRPFGIISTLLRHLQTASRMRQSVEEWAGRYQSVFDNSMEMIFLLDAKGDIINANRSAIAMLGPAVYDSGYNLTTLILDESKSQFDWAYAWTMLHPTHGKGSDHLNYDKMLLKGVHDGPRNVEFNLAPAKANDIDMAVMIMRDITAQRREENQRKNLEEQLIHSQRMEAVGVLAGGVAHDFNNLICSIQTSAEMLSRQNMNASSRAMLGNIDNASHRAAELISKLLGFAKKGKYVERLLDLSAVAEKAVDLFDIGLKDITFKFIVNPDPIMVMGDETQLQQVILNLLLNSREALLPGTAESRKITLRLDKAEPDMKAWYSHPDGAPPAEDFVVVKVKDSGSGMDEETKNRMFEPFFSTKGQNGTGLGLSMVYGCVTHHRGWLYVDSEPGKGTEISVFLPAANVPRA